MKKFGKSAFENCRDTLMNLPDLFRPARTEATLQECTRLPQNVLRVCTDFFKRDVHTLRLTFFYVNTRTCKALVQGLKKLPRITTLDFTGNFMLDDGWDCLVCELLGLEPSSSITSLRLERNNLTHAAVPALIQLSLKTLDLTKNNIGDEGAELLAQALRAKSSITRLMLECNNISPRGVSALAQALKSSQVRSLDLSHNPAGPESATILAGVLSGSGLRWLRLAHNGIGPRECSIMGKAILNLNTLDLSNNRIGDDGCGYLAASLPLSQLSVLVVSNNNIGCDGCAALAQYLPTSPLKTLVLKDNRIRDPGCEALAAALVGSSLTDLHLSNNSFYTPGVRAFSQAVPQSALRKLHLTRVDTVDPVVVPPLAPFLVLDPRMALDWGI